MVLTATDASRIPGMCSASLNVQDTTAPVAVCQNITIFLNGSGNFAVFGDVNGGSSNQLYHWRGMVSSPAIFNCTNLGPNNVTLLYPVWNGNSKSCTNSDFNSGYNQPGGLSKYYRLPGWRVAMRPSPPGMWMEAVRITNGNQRLLAKLHSPVRHQFPITLH